MIREMLKVSKSRVLHYVYIGIGIYLSIAALLYIFQRTFIYFPTPEYEHGFDQVGVQNQGEEIQVIVLNAGKADAFIYFGGNAEAVLANGPEFSLHFPDKTIYLVNYRGYGGSSGSPTEAALFSDATVIFDHFASNHENLAVVGRSLGSGVAMHLAANRPVSQVVLITPYDSVLALAKKQYPMFPISILLKDKFDSLRVADLVTAPVLALAGDRDTLIPVSHSEILIDAIGDDNAELVVIKGASHNDISNYPEFYASMKRFFDN